MFQEPEITNYMYSCTNDETWNPESLLTHTNTHLQLPPFTARLAAHRECTQALHNTVFHCPPSLVAEANETNVLSSKERQTEVMEQAKNKQHSKPKRENK